MNLQLNLFGSTGKPFRCALVQFEHWAEAGVFLIARMLESTTRLIKPHIHRKHNALFPEVKLFTSRVQPNLGISGAIPPLTYTRFGTWHLRVETILPLNDKK